MKLTLLLLLLLTISGCLMWDSRHDEFMDDIEHCAMLKSRSLCVDVTTRTERTENVFQCECD